MGGLRLQCPERHGALHANVETTPAYLAGTTGEVSTDSFYWVSRMIAAMADASYGKSVFHVERYELGCSLPAVPC